MITTFRDKDFKLYGVIIQPQLAFMLLALDSLGLDDLESIDPKFLTVFPAARARLQKIFVWTTSSLSCCTMCLRRTHRAT